MSDLIKSFAFDLQRFAGNFKGGKVEGEEGITLSNLFSSQGKVWKVTDAASLGNRTYFWENEDAKVSLTPDTANAPGSTANGIKLIRGTYDDPVTLSTGKLSYGIKSVEAIDASGVNGTATFANLEGVTRIINPKGSIDTDGNDKGKGAITFSGTGVKTADSYTSSLMGVATGTVISLDGSGNIKDVTAAAGEEITTADGTKATFKNGGKATFENDSFDVIKAFAKDKTAELNVTNGTKVTLEVGNVVTTANDGTAVIKADLNGQAIKSVGLNATSADIGFGGSEVVGKDIAVAGKKINVAGITNTSEVLYKYGAAGGDIIDLTAGTTVASGKTVAVAKTGDASFVVANDVNSTLGGTDLTIGGEGYAFTDAGDNGGVFVTKNSKVTGFIFRDINDSITLKNNQLKKLDLYDLPASSAMNVESKSGNESFAGAKKVNLPLTINTDAEYTIIKTERGYSVEFGAGYTQAKNEKTGTEIAMTVQPASANTTSTVALNFTEDGKLESITNGESSGGKENTGLTGNGAKLEISGLTLEDLATDTLTIGDTEIKAEEDGKELEYTQEVVDENGTTEVQTNQNGVYNVGGESYTVEGLSGSQKVEYTKDDDGNIIGLGGVTGDASVTGSFNYIYLNGEDNLLDIDSAEEGTQYTVSNNALAGLKNGDVVNSAAELSEFNTIEEGTFTILGQTVTIAGDSSVVFGVEDGALVAISGLSGTATGDFVSNVLSVNGTPVEVVGDEDNIIAVTGNDTGITAVTELNGADVDVKQATGATQIGDTSDGKLTLTYAAGESFTISGNGNEQTYFDLGGNNVASISGLDQGESVNGILDNVTSINGQSVAINNHAAPVSVKSVAGGLALSGIAPGAAVAVGNATINATTTGDSDVFTFADGQAISIGSDSTGVKFITDAKGRVTDVKDLDEDATYIGSFSHLEGLGVKEQPTVIGGVSAGDGIFTVEKTKDGIAKISALSGAVSVTSAGGASQLSIDGRIALDNTAVDGRNITVIPDVTDVVFELDEKGAITAINNFAGSASATGSINGLTIDGKEIDIVGDNDGLTYTIDKLSDVNPSVKGGGVSINAIGSASTVVTEGDGTFTFFDDQTFKIEGEGRAFDDGADVTFFIDGGEKVTAVGGLNGTITGNFEDAITVNGKDTIQVEGDDSVEVVGNKGASAVTAINDVDAGSTVAAWGSASVIGAKTDDGDGVYTIGDEEYSIIGSDSAFTFVNMSSSGKADVSGLESSTLAINVEGTRTIAINKKVNKQDVTVTADGNVSFEVDAKGKLVGVAGIESISGIADATIAATGTVSISGVAVNVTDADDSYSVITDAKGKVASLSAVTGDATITKYTGGIVTDADGQFEINGASYSFSDKDGIIGMNVGTAGVTNISSLEGSVILDNGDATITVNGNNVAINTGSSLPVTIASDGTAITEVTGLSNGDTISGALDKASIAMVGGDSSKLTVNKVTYTLQRDKDGVTVNGAGVVSGLDEEALLFVDTTGTYVVNGHKIVAQAGESIIGYGNGKYAELYDPDTALLRKYTPNIEKKLGLYQNYSSILTGLDGATLLAKDDSDSIFAAAEKGEYDLDQPYLVYADNYDHTHETQIKETQELDFSGTAFTKKVSLIGGSQNLKFNSDGGNLAIVSDKAHGEKNITLGGGATANAHGVGDAVIVEEGKAIGNRVNITGGAGADTVFVRANSSVDGTSADVTFNMGGSLGGADKLITYARSNARVTLENYDPNSGAGIQIEEPHARDSVGGIANAIEDGIIEFGDGIVSIKTDAGTAEVTFKRDTDEKGTLVNLYTPDGTKQGVGFTDSEGGTVDGSATSDDLIIIGNNVGKKKGDSTLIGGIGNDTVFAGAGDSINAGAGNNKIVLDTITANRGGAAIVLNAGNTVIENTNNTFYADHGDTLEVAPSAISYDGSNLIIGGASFNATVVAPDKDSVTGAAYTNQLVKDAEGKVWKMAVGSGSAVIDVKADEDIRADYYKAGGVTFKNYNGAVQVDLSKGEDAWATTIDGVEAVFENVVSLEGGSGRTVFKGSEANETFVAGKGNTSLYGAGGKNLLVGYEGDPNTKEGSTTFYVLGQNGTAVNTIQNFAFVNDDNYTNNSIAADMIEIDTANNFVTANSVEVSNSDVVFSVENRTTGVRETVLVKDAAGKDMRVTEGVIAQVAKDELTFDKFANFYLATGKNATVKVSNDQDYSKVWLDNPTTGSTFVGDIHVIDATNASVTAELAGNDYNNTIIAGSGDTSLWGGNFGDDVLVGGTGANRFYYALGNGTDTIQGAKDGDVVDLAGITLDQIDIYNAERSHIDADGLTIGLKDGGQLKVQGTDGVSYVVQGETYVLNADRTGFNKKS